jgi:hypothetical protein
MHVHAVEGPAFLLQINGAAADATFTLPEAGVGRAWHLLVDTGLATPHDWTPLDQARPMADALEHLLPARTIRLLAAR